MSEPRTKRRYDSRLRLERAARNREAMARAAQALFADRGYAGTTMGAIAERAGVAADTVYAVWGSKAALFEHLIERVEQDARSSRTREEFFRALDTDDPRRVMELLAHHAAGLCDRLAWATEALRKGGLAVPELEASHRAGQARRRHASERIARRLDARGALSPGVDVERASTVLWALTSPDNHRLLVVESGWSPDAYEAWLADILASQLLRRAPVDR